MGVVSLDAKQWANAVFGGCALGDARRTRRLVKMAGMLASQVGSAASQACDGDAAASEGAYRLIRNAAVEPEAMAEGGFEATARAALGCEELLALEDTTTLGYAHSAAAELGDLGGREDSVRRGFLVHSVLLVDALSARTVGLVEQRRWCRASSARGQRHRRAQRAYQDKESAKWERASERVAARLGATMARVISVCDRESDVYEYLRYKSDCGQRYVIRAARDRRVNDAPQARLFEALEAAPVLGEHVVELAQRGGGKGRGARTVHLELRACTVALRAPQRDASHGALTVNAVLARELSAPSGQAPVSWLLVTGEAVGDLEAARRVVRYYALRWRVEEFHKAWKSGAGVEQQRMQSADNLERIAVVLAFVAVRLLQLREALLEENAAGVAQRRCTEVLSHDEWRVLWVARERKKPPRSAPTLRWAYEAIARLGGWTDTKRTGRAGWDTMWRGWFRFQERLDTYLTTRDLLH
jgi:hypothetical protein